MQKFARFISFCLLIVFATDSFAKGVDPIRHASSSSEARLVLESLQNRILDKFERSSVDQQESIIHGLYRMSVKAQNKLQNLDSSVVADKLNRLQSENTPAISKLSGDEQIASEFADETLNVDSSVSADVDASQVSSIIKASAKSLVDLGTPVDAKGKFKALSKTQLLKNISHLTGDGDNGELARALIIIIVGFFVLLAVAAVAIVGVSFAAFGVPGAVIGLVVVGVSLAILFRR